MNKSDSFISCSDMVNSVFSNIQKKDIETSNTVVSVWSKTLESIKAKNHETGRNLSAHSRVVDLKNGILLIEADHPGWIQLLRLYETYILNGLHKAIPELTIDSLAFRLNGSNASLTDVSSMQEAEKKRIQEKLDKEEKILEERGFSSENKENSGKKKELPPELKKIFDKFKNDMLTNKD